MKRRLVEITIFATVFGAAALRLAAIASAPHQPRGDLNVVRDQIASFLNQPHDPLAQISESSIDLAALVNVTHSFNAQINQLRSEGVETIAFQRFDPAAMVVMRPGVDRLPGVAGVDDNGDGMVDNATELGATGSDDVCLVESPADFRAEPGQPMLVLERGAFVPATFAQVVASPSPARAIVTGKTASDRWSLMVEFDKR